MNTINFNKAARRLCFGVALVFGSQLAIAQTAKELPFINHPYVGKPDSMAIALEKSVANIKTKYKALGYGGVNFQYEISGSRAAIRTNAGNLAFYVNTGGNPPEFTLYRLQVKKDKRIGIANEYKTFGGGMKGSKDIIPFNVLQVSTGIYKLTPAQTLEPGEYFFGGKPVQSATSIDVYSFGIQ